MDGGTNRNRDACAEEQMKKPTRIVRKPVILIKRIRVVETRNASVMAIVDIFVCQRVYFKEVDCFFHLLFFLFVLSQNLLNTTGAQIGNNT